MEVGCGCYRGGPQLWCLAIGFMVRGNFVCWGAGSKKEMHEVIAEEES